MTVRETVLEFVERYLNIENEKKLLADDQKQLIAEFKDKLDVKAVKGAIQIAKIKQRLGDSEAAMDNMLEDVESKINIPG